jgi:hypothetical protein
MRLVRLFLLSMLVQNTAFGQPGSDAPLPTGETYLVRQYNSENGLPQNSVKDLLLDRNNFLWISTENGLVRFDGQRFRTYTTANVPGLKSNRFDVLSWTPGQDIRTTTSFDASQIYQITPEYKVVLDSAATLLPHKFISHYSNGLFDCTPLFKHLVDTALLNELCSSTFFWTLDAQEIVIRKQNDFYYLNNSTGEIIRLPVGLKRSNTQACFLNGIFFFRDDTGIPCFFKHGRQVNIKVDGSVSAIWELFGSSVPPDFFIGAKGQQAIIRKGNDIYELTIDSKVLKATLLFQDLRFLENIPLNAFQYDRKWQRLFIGTLNAGLFVVSPKLFHTLTFTTKDYSDNNFMAFQQLPGGKLITSNGILTTDGGSGSTVFANEDRPDRYCVYKAPDHSIWVNKAKHLIIYDSNFSTPKFRDTIELESRISSIREIMQALFGSLPFLPYSKCRTAGCFRCSPIIPSFSGIVLNYLWNHSPGNSG